MAGLETKILIAAAAVVMFYVNISNIMYDDAEIKHHLATKSPYRFVENNFASEVRHSGCIPTRLWALIRHGTRTGSDEVRDAIEIKLSRIRDAAKENFEKQKDVKNKHLLPEKYAKILLQWTPHPELDGKKTLTHEGQIEMLNLGERYASRFPSLLPAEYRDFIYYFRYTNTTRTRDSAKYFSVGLLGRRQSKYIKFPDPVYLDPVLRFYKLCSKWKRDVKKNPLAKVEYHLFRSSDLMNSTIANVTRRLGFTTPIPFLEVHLMYMTCSYETAWDKRYISPWCHVFTTEELKVMEYYEDLEYYWVDGYGHDINGKMPCVMFNDMFYHMTTQMDKPNVLFYFSHSGTILKFLTHLGLYKDAEPLRHDNYEQHANRKWRTSFIDSFGTNIAFISFECGRESYLMTMHQERPVLLPGCPKTSYLCPIKTIKQIYNESITRCGFDDLCKVEY